jgi:hypothetical protein
MLNSQTAAASAPDSTSATGAAAPSVEQLEPLLVLSQAPLTLDQALAEEAGEASESDVAAGPLTVGTLAIQYLSVVALFVSVGLVAAAVRHFSTEPKLYLAIGASGTVLFAAAATLMGPRAYRANIRAIASFAGASLLLGLGLGLLVGGVLHFSAFPYTAAVLVPAGIVVSIIGYVLRDGRELLGRSLLSPAITVIGIAVWVGLGLGVAAKRLEPQPVAAAQGEHGAAAEGGEHGAAAEGGEHGAAAEGGEHGAAAEGGEHGAAAEGGEHGAAATKDAHASEADHGAEHSAAKKTPAAKADHAESETAAHGEGH